MTSNLLDKLKQLNPGVGKTVTLTIKDTLSVTTGNEEESEHASETSKGVFTYQHKLKNIYVFPEFRDQLEVKFISVFSENGNGILIPASYSYYPYFCRGTRSELFRSRVTEIRTEDISVLLDPSNTHNTFDGYEKIVHHPEEQLTTEKLSENCPLLSQKKCSYDLKSHTITGHIGNLLIGGIAVLTLSNIPPIRAEYKLTQDSPIEDESGYALGR